MTFDEEVADGLETIGEALGQLSLEQRFQVYERVGMERVLALRDALERGVIEPEDFQTLSALALALLTIGSTN